MGALWLHVPGRQQSPSLLDHRQFFGQPRIRIFMKPLDDIRRKGAAGDEEEAHRVFVFARVSHAGNQRTNRAPGSSSGSDVTVHGPAHLRSRQRTVEPECFQPVCRQPCGADAPPIASGYTRHVRLALRPRTVLLTMVMVVTGLTGSASVLPTLPSPSASLAQGLPSSRGFIWRVQRNGTIGWLVGSMHMLTPDAYPLPASMTTAFAAADTLMEEADPDELASPEFAAAVLARAIYLNGETLEDHVSADTFRLIAARAAAAGLPLEAVRRMKPWMVATTLQALELQRGGFDPSLGVDLHFQKLAKTSGKRFVPLETGLEQVGFMESLAPGFEDALVRENLQTAEAEVNEVKNIETAWRAGNAVALEQILLGSLKDSPAVYQSLIVARNRTWLPKIRTCLDTTRCFIVVGAGHLVGADGLVTALRAQGYSVEQQ